MKIQHALHYRSIKPINTNMEQSKLSRRRKNVSYPFSKYRVEPMSNTSPEKDIDLLTA